MCKNADFFSKFLKEKQKASKINTHKAYRAKSSVGDWFTLTSDDDDDEADQVQNGKRRRKVTKIEFVY